MATQNFGPARYGLTRYGGTAIIFASQPNPGACYVFSIKKNGDNKSLWKCTKCHKLKHPNSAAFGSVSLISVEADQILTDPDNPKNNHFCQPENVEVVEAFQIQMEANDDVKRSGKRLREAYQEASAKVTRRFAHDHTHKQAVQSALPAYSSAKPGLYRAYGSHYPVVNSISQIPPRLEMTLEGATSTDPQDPKYQERYLLMSQVNPPFLIFASPEDLANLYQSEHWVADGTFQYRPTDYPFAQLYIIFAFKNGELSMLCRELGNGAAPNLRLQRHVQKDADINNAKRSFQQSVSAIDPNHSGFLQQMDSLIVNYLDAISQLIGH